MKIKTPLILLILIVTTLTSLTSQTMGPSISYPSPGDIGGGTGGALWNAWDPKEDAVPYFINLANNYGGSYESIGESSGNKGWDIILFKFGNPNGGTVMVDAYLHGNEFYGYQVLKSVITWLVTSNDADAQRILQNNYVLVVPMANYRWGRTNYNIPTWMTFMDYGNDGDPCGVNLNRNFGPSWSSSLSHVDNDDYAGASADSEPESQALINAWTTYQPRIYWNLHQGIEPTTMCTARTSQAQEDANDVRSLLPSIQSRLGVSNGWSFSVSSGYGSGYAKDGAASRGSAGFLTEVMSGWDATEEKKADLESGNTFKQVKAMFIAMCQAVEGSSPPPPSSQWSITISSSSGGTTSISGTQTINVGQSLTVTTNPNAGYQFDSWRLDGSTYSTFTTVTIPSQADGTSHTLVALFSETASVTHTLSSTGSIVYRQVQSDISVNVNPLQEIADNRLSVGFQLDGRDISAFASSSTLQNFAEEANFKMVRFFHHRYGWAATNWDNTLKTGTWNWNNYDRVVNAITGIGAEPLVCLGYGGSGEMTIPSGMQRWSQDAYFPDPEQFAAYAREWVRHFQGQVKYWEILNEPYQHYYWTDQSKLERYCAFWNIVAREMRQEDPTILISHDGSTVKDALDYWVDNGDDLDFLDFHKYDSSSKNPATDAELFARAESEWVTDYGGSQSSWRNYGVQQAKNVWSNGRGETVPVICGEANINWAYNPTDSRIQTMTAAVWAALTIRYQALAGLDYWLWWDFYGSGDGGQTQFSMISPDYEPWYSYYTMKMIGTNLGVGDSIVQSSSSSEDVRTFAWNHNGNLNVLLICKTTEDRTVSVNGFGGSANYFKVDSSGLTLQSGNINIGTESITMDGYSVILLQSST